MDNLGAIRLRSAFQFWPLLLIFLGGYLIFKYMHSEKSNGVLARKVSKPAQTTYTPPPASTPSADPVVEVVKPQENEGENQ